MNKQNFNQSGGFPLQTETLAEMQTAYELFNNLGSLAGNFSIIKGCEITGSTVANGVVYIDGELLPFQGGNLGTNVIIVETYITQEFQDGTDKVVIVKRYATFGIDSISYPWANFKKPKTTIELTEQKEDKTAVALLLNRIIALEARPISNVPIGMIAIWDLPAVQIPIGWIEYLPLRGRSPIGLDPNDVDLDGLNTPYGSKTAELDLENMFPHDHDVGLDPRDLSAGTDGSRESLVGGPTNPNNVKTTKTGGLPNGTAKPFSIMDPKRVVHFIQFKG